MSDMSINAVLAEMRTMAAQLDRPLQGPGPASAPVADFSTVMQRAIETVNQTQKTADVMSQAYVRGDSGLDLSEVMVQVEKASLSFEAVTQVRNRLVNAYQEIMNMPI